MTGSDPLAMSEMPELVQSKALFVKRQFQRRILLRAVIYTPVVLAVGGLSAASVFPDLAEFVSPLLDISRSGSPSAPLASTPGCCHDQACRTSQQNSGLTVNVNLAATGMANDESPADALQALESAAL